MSVNTELSELFERMAAMMELKGESAFKAIAFSKVARLLRDATFDVAQAARDGTLADIEGIGPSSRKIIEEYLATGKSSDVEQVAAQIPAGLLPMLEIPGLGPKTVRLLWQERGITSIDQLEKALADGSLAGLKGIGEKKLKAIADGLALRKASAGRVGIAEAEAIAGPMLQRLLALPGVAQAEVAGSLRRRKETIGDVDLVCCLKPGHTDGHAVTAAFAAFPGVSKVLGQGGTKASVLTDGGLQVDCRVVPAENFGAALMYFTGSKEHNVRCRALAQSRGMTLNEWGLFDARAYDAAARETGKPPDLAPVAAKTEQDIYRVLGLPWIPPELREDRGEFDRPIPRLVTESDLKGDLHTHTTASDGHNSIEEMAEAARALGYEYLAITDHSRSQAIANGLSIERLLAHVEAVRAAGRRIKGIHLLAGSEVDILADGSLDYPDEVLAQLDWVVASPHVALKQDTEKATARIVRAIENPYVHVIGHPTGRLLGSREGLPLDFARVIDAARSNGTALEINAGYPRLDLSEVPARRAIEAGVWLCINTDAHAVSGFAERRWGIGVARRAWVEPKHVLNCLPWKQLQAWSRRKRG
ncbi:MAG: DNA polymerase/3'-5' exonuclease PolX [Tepidisphaerales bacterium]